MALTSEPGDFSWRLSDEDLAAKGVTRQDVVRHIFRDRYYI